LIKTDLKNLNYCVLKIHGSEKLKNHLIFLKTAGVSPENQAVSQEN
jgi:hypothetical protein